MSGFARKLIAWQRKHGRHDLPWQGTRDPYRIWLAETMLQQTQVAAVIPYYQRFLRAFPSLDALAGASQDHVLRLWSGLGYYARARNLWQAARRVARENQKIFPDTRERIALLPGVGRSTAAAIAVFAFGRRAAILDGNVKRVLSRCFGVIGEKPLWALAEELVPRKNIERYTQGLMDLGAVVCLRRQPRCEACPLMRQCVALHNGTIDVLPAPRPKKPYPEKKATWLVLVHAGQVLLERRPPSGLWGGLWTFPELKGRNLKAYCRSTLGCSVGTVQRLATMRHGFTHFRLHIQPLLCRLRAPPAASRGRLWLELADAAAAAVPSPVRAQLRLLASR